VKEDRDHIEDLLKQKKELEQSIKYASYIQKALLPSAKDLKIHLANSFILSLPRDVVSGDFFWIDKNKNQITLAVGDSTGHGVPGAFLSILGISFLNLVASKHKPTNPADLLNYLREYIMKALNQTGQNNEQKDGIDLSVCMFNTETGLFYYASSYNPAYIIHNKKLEQLASDKMPVGVDAETEKPFTNTEFQLKPGDQVYLFTDGFPDQFGGKLGKKYKYSKFRDLIIECSKLSFSDQEKFLLSELDGWRGSLPQLDDITILGFKYE
jgi:serine phosphatase RsbU (regulator of sigma subunit)